MICRLGDPRHSLGKAQSLPRLAIVEVPDAGGPGRPPVPTTAACVRGRLHENRRWSLRTPVVAALEEGRVTSVSDGSEEGFFGAKSDHRFPR